MMNTAHKTTAALTAAILAAILLTGCGTPEAPPPAEETDSGPRPNSFYYYDPEREAWQTLGEDSGSPAAVYVDAATNAVTADLVKQRAYTKEEAEALLAQGGLEIYLCMDAELQTLADTACREQNKPENASKSGEPMESAVVLLENATGKVLALSGGAYDGKKPNPATQALHSPGPALVPLSAYAPALELGKLTPESMVKDQPDEHNWPVNPSGSYHDAISVKEALRTASNCVPVAILDQYLTLEDSARFVQENFSIALALDGSEEEPPFTDLNLAALALGGLTDGVTPLDLAAAYAVFPQGGAYVTPAFYTKVVDRDGNELLSGEPSSTRVLKEDTASAMTDMLGEVVANGVGEAAKLAGQDAAGMPGLTASKKDLWFVGYTTDYTAAVWSGYHAKESITLPGNPSAALWKQVMQGASAD